ncbi:pentatricopeptide repeat-containing protein [Nicotiana attenuata]|uniref:Pentatricopeptide repeat-containing protein n=1 Tax=Nicotiana attenuata TaxID=49451 RepID=A0A314LJC1_NICAT|nr:pentatricopeptide repeat-containing protein [Nicotiana attenuata]
MKQVDGDCVLPDEITFVGVLCACAREGLLTEARTHFGDMSNVFGVKPDFVHYWCMANLLAHVGLMQEALQILKNISIESNLPLESSLWSELLGSTRFRGDVIVGEQIANKLLEQDPENFQYYLLLVNIYAAAGRWDEVAQTKEMMKKRGMERVPDCSLKDLKELVHNMLFKSLNSVFKTTSQDAEQRGIKHRSLHLRQMIIPVYNEKHPRV